MTWVVLNELKLMVAFGGGWLLYTVKLPVFPCSGFAIRRSGCCIGSSSCFHFHTGHPVLEARGVRSSVYGRQRVIGGPGSVSKPVVYSYGRVSLGLRYVFNENLYLELGNSE